MTNNNLTDERLSALIRVARDSLELYEMELPVIDDVILALAELQQRRAAMLQGADGKPELTVWYGAMPETNGKTNWTAILHRKGEGRCMDGFTIDRSEYPGRVLYAADRVRYLIGEKSERPSILDYDADAHSGYVKPGNSPVIPDGWVLAPLEPTEEMCDVGHVGVDVLTGVTDGNEYYSIDGDNAAKVYRAMIAAAPQQEVKP